MKKLMDGYVGIKYVPIVKNKFISDESKALFGNFQFCGNILNKHNMAWANAGNMSHRCANGMVITASGCNLAVIEPQELSEVHGCCVEKKEVNCSGGQNPSSEAIMHWLIYQRFPNAKAIVHAHDELATSLNVADQLPETRQEEPYGTVELGQLAAETFLTGSKIIVLKNHGYVAIGISLEEATSRIIQMHLWLSKHKSTD
jgi:L-fuculose-phosphate aldolase